MEDTENKQEPTSLHSIDPPSRKRVLLPIVIILAIVVVALMAIKASVHKEVALNTQQFELNEGVVLPNFPLVKLDGTKIQIGDVDKKVMMINFWATWCEACMVEMPSIVALREKFAPKGFEILGVTVDEDPNQVVPAIVKKFGMNFPVFTDQGNVLAELFDVHAIPLTVIVNKDRKILLVESGERDWNGEDINQMVTKWTSE
jgi:thiol-disulfide isomerase/thioredoxin